MFRCLNRYLLFFIEHSWLIWFALGQSSQRHFCTIRKRHRLLLKSIFSANLCANLVSHSSRLRSEGLLTRFVILFSPLLPCTTSQKRSIEGPWSSCWKTVRDMFTPSANCKEVGKAESAHTYITCNFGIHRRTISIVAYSNSYFAYELKKIVI